MHVINHGARYLWNLLSTLYRLHYDWIVWNIVFCKFFTSYTRILTHWVGTRVKSYMIFLKVIWSFSPNFIVCVYLLSVFTWLVSEGIVASADSGMLPRKKERYGLSRLLGSWQWNINQWCVRRAIYIWHITRYSVKCLLWNGQSICFCSVLCCTWWRTCA